MKIYVAGSFQDQKDLRDKAVVLWSMGHTVTGTWLHEVARSPCLSEVEHKRKIAMKDLVEVREADLIALDNRQSSGGKNVEWGVSLAHFQHKLMVLIGEPSNVFHYLADYTFESWDKFYNWLGEFTHA